MLMGGSQAALCPALPPSAPWLGQPCEGEKMGLAAGEKILNGQNYSRESGGEEAVTCTVLGWEADSSVNKD